MCNLSPEEQMIVMAMIRTYEKFIAEELKVPEQDYDFSQHEKVEKKLRQKTSAKLYIFH
jgi:hypothetical protein